MKSIIFILIFLFSVSCSKKVDIYNFKGSTMGTYYSIKIAANSLDEEQMKIQIEVILKEVNQVFSTYIKDSEVSRLNDYQGDGPVSITPVMKDLILLSKQINKSSDGFFDPTVGPLVNLWGFGPGGKRKKPSDKEIKNMMSSIGIENISIQGNQLSKRTPGIYLDFSSIAKGQGVDDVGLVLESKGLKDYLVEIGGEVRARGKKPDGSLWAIGIETPSEVLGQTIQKVVHLNNQSIATSGSYRNYLKYGNDVFSHTISPKTGKPITHKLLSVSVISENCANADGWSTALMAMGPEKGLEKANELGLKAYFLVKDKDKFKEMSTTNFGKSL